MVNPAIKCDVDACRYNISHYCSRDHISVGDASAAALTAHDTNCASFESRIQ